MTATAMPLRPAAMWALLAALLATVFTLATYPNIPPASDLWDYSQEARQLGRGEGFTSLYTYPVHLGQDEPPFPVRWRMPLYAALGAGLWWLGVPLPAGYFLIAILAHAILVALVFLLTAHLHSVWAASLAAAAAIASPLLLDPYSAGLSQVPAAALGVGVWLLLLRGRGSVSAVAAAVLAATAWYLRSESLVMAPLWIWAAARGGRARRGVAFTAAYAAICIPWLFVYRALAGTAAPIQGNPMLLYTPEFPGYSSSRTYGEIMPGILEYLLAHPLAFAWRFVKDLMGYGVDLLWGLGPIAVGLGIAGLLLREPKERWGSLRPAMPLLIAAAVQVAAFSALERSPRFLVPAVPLVCAALGIAAAPSLDRICGRRRVIALFAILIVERCVMLGFETRQAARRFPPLPPTFAAELREELARVGALRHDGRRHLIWTDSPDWIAWHLDHPALLLPLWRQKERVAGDHPVRAIVLTREAPARNAADGE
ncbi:MAG TPA: hypothetical protein VFP58_00905, partial [Candidatus Eisenbacteria bacterium]|nr:hypothetical protein [Candidatus Eisenbacteria bacterium]